MTTSQSGAETWPIMLKHLFDKLGSPVDPTKFITELRNITDQNFLIGFEKLAKKEQDQWIKDLQQLSHYDNLADDVREPLFQRISERYEEFFDWEEDSTPTDNTYPG